MQRARPAGYEAEVLIAESVAGEGFELRISGRMDGVWVVGECVVVEEIKTVVGRTAAPVKARGKGRRMATVRWDCFPRVSRRARSA